MSTKKSFTITANVGRARHVVSFHDGVKTHADGSPFFDISIFSSMKKRDAFTRALVTQGYAAR